MNNGEHVEIAAVDNDARSVDNVGFGAGCNRGARETDADVLVFVNPDTVVQPGAVAALARALEDPDVGVVQARLRLLDRPELLNSSGNVVHVSGLAWPGGYGDPADDAHRAARRSPTRAARRSRSARDVFRELGGFTEELFLYQEDLELCWRAHLHGLRVLVVPDADVLHDYVLERPGRQKEYYLERNRLIVVLSAFSARLLLAARARAPRGRGRDRARRVAAGLAAGEGARLGLAPAQRAPGSRPTGGRRRRCGA